MKRFAFLALLAVAFVAAFAQNPAEALQSLKAYKILLINVVVTPSPTPIVFNNGPRPNANAARLLVADPSRGAVQMASISNFDVPIVVAQATPQGNIPVTFNSKPDPTSAYLKLLPSSFSINAAYGANTYTCPFQIFGYYSTTWKITDWGYGTVSSGSGTFPVENYPTTSYLAWNLSSVTSSFTNYANSGSPGQLTVNGVAGVSQTFCVNLSLTVPSSLAAGNYTAAIQYNMYAN